MFDALGTFSEDQDFVCQSDGVCRPLDAETLRVYKQLQEQINYCLSQKGIQNRINVDGEIGGNTVNAMFQLYQAGVPLNLAGGAPHVAKYADGFVMTLMRICGQPGSSLWDTISKPFETIYDSIFGSKPSSSSSSSSAPKPAASGGGGLSLSTPLLLGGGVLAFALWRRSKGKGGKKRRK